MLSKEELLKLVGNTVQVLIISTCCKKLKKKLELNNNINYDIATIKQMSIDLWTPDDIEEKIKNSSQFIGKNNENIILEFTENKKVVPFWIFINTIKRNGHPASLYLLTTSLVSSSDTDFDDLNIIGLTESD